MVERVVSVSADITGWRATGDLELPPMLTLARDAFYEHGYDGASVREIARRVGVTVPALYYHYENKQALLLAILDASISRLTDLCRLAVVEAGMAPDARFLNLIECITLYEAHSGRTAMCDREQRLLSEPLRHEYVEKRKYVELLLLAAVQDGMEQGIFSATDAKETTRALLGMLQAIPHWFKPGGDMTPEELAERYKDIAARTVGASTAVLDGMAAKV